MSHPDQLAHTLRARHITMIALGGVVGAGFFVGASSAILKAGPVVFVSYMLAGLLIYLVNLALRDLALEGPGKGSFMMQIRETLGFKVGFLAGWAYWLTWVIVLAAEVIAGAAMLKPFIPLPYWVIELSLLLSMTAVNLLSVRGYAEFEYWFSLIKLVAIGVFAVIAIWALFKGFMGWGVTVPVHHNLFDFGGLIPKGWPAILAVIPTILFSMTGSEIVTVAALESDDPDGNIVRITRTIAWRILGFYLTSIALILCFVPWSDLIPTKSPFLVVLNQIGVPFSETFVWIVIFSAVLSTLNSAVYVTSRILYELAENGDAPAFFLKVDAKKKLPVRAIMAGTLVAILILLTAIVSRDQFFALLLSITGTLMLFNNLLIILAQMKIDKIHTIGPKLACLLLACSFGAMLWVPETRSQALLGFLAIFVISIASWWRYRLVSAKD
ncbi:amino acid permease [Aristophania vespae]|uniref:Amino acid permease n=1 Tax=Aristophania vespae TaxID=2697033 RepID=A0A6P1NHI6_9PROT|nr:amino acid permease [Aristophania vespae]QHI95122.1 amino acid permease [Aristophania vespae]